MIRFGGVSVRFGSHFALAPLDLVLSSEQTAVLIGSSGSGKSTILRLIAGLIAPDAGAIHVEGTRVGLATLAALRLRMGYVIQEGGLFPHLTARANVELMARYLQRPPAERAARVAELAALARLPEDALERYPTQLSGGQRQRVSLMRALMLDPPVLLLDEPLGALDPMIRAELASELRDIFRTLRKTVVWVTHDLREAAYLADRVLLLRCGRVVQDGALIDLFERPAEPFVTQFVHAQTGRLPDLSMHEPQAQRARV
jgi:osmoprotectant transport system ATP-binding protein